MPRDCCRCARVFKARRHKSAAARELRHHMLPLRYADALMPFTMFDAALLRCRYAIDAAAAVCLQITPSDAADYAATLMPCVTPIFSLIRRYAFRRAAAAAAAIDADIFFFHALLRLRSVLMLMP